MKKCLISAAVALSALLTATDCPAAVFLSDTIIDPLDLTYEGQEIVVSNCTLTVDGPHSFANLRVAGTGVLTHSPAPNGLVSIASPVTGEPQILEGTNSVLLGSTNVITSSVTVFDLARVQSYVSGLDYVLGVSNEFATLQRTEASSIPDGATVLVDYLYATGSTNSGLNLTLTGDLEVEPGAQINADARGYALGNGPGRSNRDAPPLNAGGGGGAHGGNGGRGSGHTADGAAFDSLLAPIDKGGCGGAGTDGPGGPGGGAIRLQVTGDLKLGGSISANGGNGSANRSGGGGGGSVWIGAQSITGQGSISVNGGVGESPHGGGGGAGRIALYSSMNVFSGLINAQGGNGSERGGAGTVYTESENSSIRQIILNNAGIAGATTPLTLTSGADLIVTGAAAMAASSSITVNNFLLGSGGRFVLLNPSLGAIQVSATNAIIEPGASIDLDGAGAPAGFGNGRGGSYSSTAVNGGGAGHGGYGGGGVSQAQYLASGGTSYGNPAFPTTYGSGGGGILSDTIVGGAGGGAFRLSVSGTLTLNGSISANGMPGVASGGGGGSGGSVWISAGAVSGSGVITANGGSGVLPYGGGGGGGRVAIDTLTNLFDGFISACGGTGINAGGAGTIYYNSQAALILDNGGLSGTNTPVTLSGNLTVRGGARAVATSDHSFTSLMIDSNSVFFPLGNYGSLITVTGDLVVEKTGRIDADGRGFRTREGPGSGGSNGGGAGHAGYGGAGSGYGASGGKSYANTLEPMTPGSGGANDSYSRGGSGGGVIRLVVHGKAVVEGDLTANGTSGQGYQAGGGSGGSVNLTVAQLSGTGRILAHGANGGLLYGGGGSGGCIKVQFTAEQTNGFSGLYAAYGGSGYRSGAAGTVVIRPHGTDTSIITVGNAGLSDTNTVIAAPSYPSSAYLRIGAGARVVFPSDWRKFSGLLLIQSNAVLLTSGYGLTINGDVIIEEGGTISGYDASSGSDPANDGYYGILFPSKGGGGHGGFGGLNPPGHGRAHGSITAPVSSGGAGANALNPPYGGKGGGAIRLTVNGNFVVDGTLSSDGSAGEVGTGGGAGGSIWLTTSSLAGSGRISADGSAGTGQSGGGGGGRIALYYATNQFSGPISARGGDGLQPGGAGTIYIKPDSATVGHLLISNGGFAGTNTPLSSLYSYPAVPFDLRIDSGAVVHFSGTPPLLSNVFIGEGSKLTYAGFAQTTNMHLAMLGDLIISSNASLSFDAAGHARGSGFGAGSTLMNQGAGGGHGGVGGSSASGAAGGGTYGSAAEPVLPGSSGGLGFGPITTGSEGGGAVHLMVGKSLVVDGRLSANGGDGIQDESGGGAGGSIWVTAASLNGGGIISADGGNGEFYNGGGGGGGRIAIYTRTNNFTGLSSAYGGWGAGSGSDGTIQFFEPAGTLTILAQNPSGIVTNPLVSVDLTFSDPINPYTLSSADVFLQTPSMILPDSSISVKTTGPSILRVTFPQQTSVGDYVLRIGPDIENIWGQPLSQTYTGAFTVVLPTIEGTVTDTNGGPLAGVFLQPSGNQSGAISDSQGRYRVGVAGGWSGTLSSSLAGFMFVPRWREYTNVTAAISDQNFLAVPTTALNMLSGRSDTNYWLRWHGIAGVNYRVQSSTNLLNWEAHGEAIAGTNGTIELLVPIDSETKKFFRFLAEN